MTKRRFPPPWTCLTICHAASSCRQVCVKYLVAPSALVLFLAVYGNSIAGPESSCGGHADSASCVNDTACQWVAAKSKCKKVKASQTSGKAKAAQPAKAKATQEPWKAETKLPYHDCSVHKGQGYCENDTANNCHWGDKSAQCLGPGKPDKVGHRK